MTRLNLPFLIAYLTAVAGLFWLAATVTPQ